MTLSKYNIDKSIVNDQVLFLKPNYYILGTLFAIEVYLTIEVCRYVRIVKQHVKALTPRGKDNNYK